jgi:hypothetical protein
VSCTESTQMQMSPTRPQLSYKTPVWSWKRFGQLMVYISKCRLDKDGCCNIHERIYFELAAPIWGLLTRSSMACARPEIVHRRLVCCPSPSKSLNYARMGAYARLYLFSGSDREYIRLLEKALQALQFHHLNCPLGPFSTTTESNRPTKRRRDGTAFKPPAVLESAGPTSCLSLLPPGTSLSSTLPDGAPSTRSLTASSAPAASHNPRSGSDNPPKKARAEPWKKAADALINDTPVAEKWKTPWIVESAVSSYDCHSPAKLILGTSPPNTISGVVETDFQDEILARAATFASNIANYGNRADLYAKIHSFHEIVLGSICVVLLDCGKPQEDVDSIMQIHISNAEPKHLNRLRNGAKWANSLVNALHWRGWGKRAQEVLFHCKSHKAILDGTISYRFRGQTNHLIREVLRLPQYIPSLFCHTTLRSQVHHWPCYEHGTGSSHGTEPSHGTETPYSFTRAKRDWHFGGVSGCSNTNSEKSVDSNQ